MEKKLFILFLCMIPVVCGVAFGISFNQAYYSQQKFSPKTASWNDPIGQFIAEAVVIIERRDMDDPNSTKIKGPNHKLVFGPEDPNDDDFYFIWNEPNDMGLYNDGSDGNATFNFGGDANGLDVMFNSTTAGDYMLWDSSNEALIFEDSQLFFNNGNADGQDPLLNNKVSWIDPLAHYITYDTVLTDLVVYSSDGVSISTGMTVYGNSTLRENTTIGRGTAGEDYTLTFDGQDDDGVITWMEDESQFSFDSDDVAFGDGAGVADKVLTFNGIVDGTLTWDQVASDFSFSNSVDITGDLDVSGDANVIGDIYCDDIFVTRYARHVQLPAMLVGNAANKPAAASFDTVGGLSFASTLIRYTYVQWEIPDDWDGTDIIFEVDWFAESGPMTGTDAIKWDVEYRSVAEGELVSQGTIAIASSINNDDNVQYLTVHSPHTLTFDHADQELNAQDHIFFRISRDTALNDVGVAVDFSGPVLVPAWEIIYYSTSIPTN